MSLLGPIEVCVDGHRVALAGQRRLAVLAVLALRAGRVVPVDGLVDAVWGFDPPAGAAGTLQSHVSHLRRALGPASGALVSRPPGYLLDLPADRVDVHRFEELAAAGRAALAAGRPAEAAEHLARALALWRGPALADLAGVELGEREARRLEEGRLAALEDRTDAELALGRHRQLVAGLAEVVAAHPLRERLAAQLMLALYRCERQAEALQVYQATRRQLIDDLGIEPSRPLQALEESILLQKPELDLPAGVERLRPVAVAALPRPVDRIRARGELVGRDELVAQLCRSVSARQHPLLLLTGEPGIGKSRLAAEVAHRAAADNALVLYGRCDHEGGAPYHPVADALADLAERDETTPLLDPQLAHADADAGPAARSRAFDRVAEALDEAGAGRVVLVLVDDLHWADRGTIALLRHLVLGRQAGRFALLATCRSTGERPPWLVSFLEQAAADEQLATVDVEPLLVADVARLATSLGLAVEAAALHSATGGNPLLVRQLSRGDLEAAGGERRWGSLAMVLDNRIAALSPAARSVLEVAAVAGTRFELGVVAAAADLDASATLEALDEARRARLVDEVEDPARFSFAHDVVREFLADRIPAGRRLPLHAALGAALERLGGEASAIAHHHLAAAPLLGHDVASARVAEAADRARQRLAFEDAAELYRTAADLLRGPRPAGGERWEEVVLGMAAALFDAGDPSGARAAVLEVADAARRRGDAVRLAEAAIAYQGRWIPTAIGLDENHLTLLHDARSLLGDGAAPGLQGRLDARLALAAFHTGGDEATWITRAASAVEHARASGEPRALAEALTARHTTSALALAPRQRLDLCTELRQAALRAGDAETLANAYAEAAVNRLAAGDVAGARGELSRFDGHAEAIGSATLRWRRAVLAGAFALADGRFADAEAASGRALALGTDLGQDDAAFAWAAQTFVSTWCRFGAAPVAGAAADLTARHPEVPAWTTVHALALADAGRPQDAMALLRPLGAGYAAVPRDLLWMSAVATAAEAVVRCGDADAAPCLIELLEPHCGQLIVVGAGVALLGPVDRALGLLHALSGRPGDAQRHLAGALDVLPPGELGPFRAMTLLARAEVAASSGAARERVTGDASEAARLAWSLGMAAVAGRAEALATAARRA